MSSFTISQLASYSGIKPHTIRAWETRYRALRPHRSAGNTRYYDDDQLRRLLNIVNLVGRGYKVSDVCVMSEVDLNRLVLDTAELTNTEFFVSQLISAGLSYDSAAFEKTFSEACSSIGTIESYQSVIYPLLQRVGLLWAGKDIPSAKEHFVSNLVRRKLHAAIDILPQPSSSTPKWVLFLPDNEYHETGLLLAEYLLRSKGQQVIYLGNNVSLESLQGVVDDTHPDFLLFFLVAYNNISRVQLYVDELSNDFKMQQICISASESLIDQLRRPENVVWLHDASFLANFIEHKTKNTWLQSQ